MSKTNQKFGKLFAKKKKQTTKVKLVDEKETEIEAPSSAKVVGVDAAAVPIQQTEKQIQKQEQIPEQKQQPEKKEKKPHTFNWFDDDQDSNEDQIPEARLDLIKDRKQIQTQKKKEEANRRGQEFWDDQANEGAQNLIQKRVSQQQEKERIKKQQSQILKNAKTQDQIFQAYQKITQLNAPIKPNQIKSNKLQIAEDEFISLEQQTQMAKIGKKKAAAMSANIQSSQKANASEQVMTKTGKAQESKYKNQFRDLGGDRESDDEDDSKKNKNKFIKGDKKPGEGYTKKHYESKDIGWNKGTGQVEKQQERKIFSKKEDNGFKLGGGTVEKPKPRENGEQVTFNRKAFGSGQVEPLSAKPFKRREFDNRQNDASKGFNREKFGTGKSEFKEDKPRFPTKHRDGDDERRSKNDTWSKGGGFKRGELFSKDKKQESQNTKQSEVQIKVPVKREAKVLVNENKNENCWDEDL